VHILAREVLEIVQDDDALLRALQKVVLRPLELRMIEECSRSSMSAYDVVSSTRAVLRSLTQQQGGKR
jgi:hypothetical protein